MLNNYLRGGTMFDFHKSWSTVKLWYILIGITVFRLFYLLINFRPLNIEEAQYWIWSRQLSFGYHSKPPLIAWIISLTTHLFGNGYFGVRCIVPIVWLITTYFLYLAAKKLFDRTVAAWTAISFFLMPSVVVSATIISVDPLMLMFWACALYLLVYALQSKRCVYWLLLGVAIGLSALTKYTGLFFLLCLFLYCIFNRKQRAQLLSYKFYLMLLAVFLVLLPNIIWNIHHGFTAVRHVIYHNANICGFHLHFKNLMIFLLSQLGMFTVFFLPIYFYCAFRKKYWQNQQSNLLLWFSLPVLIIIMLEALFSRAYANWAAVSYLAATVLVVAILVRHKLYRWLKINLFYCIAIMLAFYVIDFGVMHNLIKLPKYPHVYRASFGWESAGQKIKLLSQRYPKANFIFDNRELWAKSVYFAGLPLDKVYVWSDNGAPKFEMYSNWNAALKQDFIWLSFNKNLNKNFTKIKPLISIELKHYRTIYVYYLKNFQGRFK